MRVQERLYTADDLWVLSHSLENQAKRFVLIEGELYEMAPAGWEHGDVVFNTGLFIGNHVKQHGLGRITAAETGFILYHDPTTGKDTVLAPDIGFIAAERVPEKLTRKYVPFAPDLAVEVVSPGNTNEEISLKIEAYLRYGTRMVWIFYPDSQKVHAYRAGREGNQASVKFLGINDILDGEDVLPGFKIPLRAIFNAE